MVSLTSTHQVQPFLNVVGVLKVPRRKLPDPRHLGSRRAYSHNLGNNEGVRCCDLSNLRRGGVTNIRDVIQISQIPQLCVPVTIFRKCVFYILVFFGKGVLNKPRNQGSFGTFGTGFSIFRLLLSKVIKVLFISLDIFGFGYFTRSVRTLKSPREPSTFLASHACYRPKYLT